LIRQQKEGNMPEQSAVHDSGEAPCYLTKPPSGSGPGVLVLHPWWGLNPFMRSFCDRLAAPGFTVLAPDLYHGKIATTIEDAEKLSSNLVGKIAKQEILQAAERLRSEAQAGDIALIGFSLGGNFALWLAEQPAMPIAATVVFYGSRGGEYTAGHSAFQLHMAESDPYESASGVKKMQKALKAAGKDAELYTYPGTSHWFFESDRVDAYNAQAATLAWERTVQFLGKYLR
jgi:carboxymethylenebutenolidase